MHEAAAPAADGDSTAWGDAVERQLAPALVFGTTGEMQLMQEEIFGPILPVISYERIEDVINAINASPRPLALYWFGNDEAERDAVLTRTVSGGVCVNDTLLHVAHDNLPFGGVGDSGWGAYHSEQGFCALSIRRRSLCSRVGLRRPCCIHRSARNSTA